LNPPQGFRHAVALLVNQWSRTIPANASSEDVAAAVSELARELVALAGDMRASAETAQWLLIEFTRTLDRLPQSFDRQAAMAGGTAILSEATTRHTPVDRRDLFITYAPEDRLPIAAPLAVELTKRRISIAFADYEVSSSEELTSAIRRGLDEHRGGAVLWTPAFARFDVLPPTPEDDRLRVVQPHELATAATLLTGWVRQLRVRGISK
jgi:hypothetical protein